MFQYKKIETHVYELLGCKNTTMHVYLCILTAICIHILASSCYILVSYFLRKSMPMFVSMSYPCSVSMLLRR